MKSVAAIGIILAAVTFVIVVLICVFFYLHVSFVASDRVATPRPKLNIPFLKYFANSLDSHSNFTQLAQKYGRSCKEHDVITLDGFVLKLFHVPGDSRRPVLLMHGFLDSADTFIIRGGDSLVTSLAKAGYDVWAGNFRGNKYSRRHIKLDPDKDTSFWDFSFHEFGIYDLPAVIDFVLLNTGQKSLQAITHSVGGTSFLVMGSERPQYNEKIKTHIALAPLCHMSNIEPPLSMILVAEPFFSVLLAVFGKKEAFGSHSQTASFIGKFCSIGLIGKPICLEGGIFRLTGRDDEEVKSDFLPVIFGHYPAGTSMSNVNHLVQLYLKGKFTQYHDGVFRNLISFIPFFQSEYGLSKVTMKTAIFVASNDKVSTLKDGELLRKDLPNVVDYRVMGRTQFNHIDFVWGENMKEYLFPQIFEVLEKY
ncbi:Lipase [Operophtera brumata]|uniref:Lipase n=1 Tax=Operophtera brumata TaxID=104452 RepID=A0A0L7KQV5_OPEBR|nr:Lipase [Operophtera brumata]